MWKWIVAGGVLMVVLLATCWTVATKLSGGGSSGPTTVTIAASPERVFASFATADSLATWMLPGNLHAPHGSDSLQVGDTLPAVGSVRIGGRQSMTWVVTEVIPGRLLATEQHDVMGRAVISRRDSLAPSGDSTIVVSTFGSPSLDSVLRVGGKGKVAFGGTMEKFVVSMMRTSGRLELEQLKNRIEGKRIRRSTPVVVPKIGG